MKFINRLTKKGGEIKSVAVRESEVVVRLWDGTVIVYVRKKETV